MADYNIYIHGDGGGNNDDPTKPFQTRNDGEGKFDPTQVVSKASSFVQNPDSIISSTMGAGIRAVAKAGVVGALAVIAVKTVVGITDKVITLYNNYASSAGGNYNGIITYNNFKQTIHNVFTPVSTEIQRQQAQLEIRKANAVNEQQRLLTGGTILNAQNGRYL